jgi:DNA-directed RNA polymerase specialized sigma24 family protein
VIDDAATYDPLSGEFYKQFFMERLRPIAEILCGDPDRAKDLVQDTSKWFYHWRPWLREGLATYGASLRYTTTVMKNIHASQSVEDPLAKAVELEGIISLDPPPKVARIQRLVEWRNLVIKVLRLFKDDKQMQTFICLKFLANMSRAEIAAEMNLDPREVTDLERRFEYRIKQQKGFKILGLVSTKPRARTGARKKKSDS